MSGAAMTSIWLRENEWKMKDWHSPWPAWLFQMIWAISENDQDLYFDLSLIANWYQKEKLSK